MRTIRIISMLAVMSLSLLFLGNGSLLAQTTPPEPEPVDTTLDALLAKAGEEGGVRVIVGLRLAGVFKPEGAMTGPAEAAGQQAAIDKAQTDLLDNLATGKITVVARYKSVPFMALKLNKGALQRLIDSGMVTTIQEDKPVPADLAAAMPMIGANQMWSLGKDGTGWVVAILDTGIDEDHPFLKGRIIQTDQACFSTNDVTYGSESLCPNHGEFQIGKNSANAMTPKCIYSNSILCAHGTHVAGIAAGKATSGSPGNGVAPAAKILPIQVFSRFPPAYCGGSSPCVLTWLSDQMNALDYLYSLRTKYKIASANMSLGGGRYTSACDTDSRKFLVDNLLSVGIPTVIAAANSSYSDAVGTPACISTAITIGATDDGDQLAAFGNRGPLLDLFAPGVNITSSFPNNAWGTISGTSMAAPVVAGAFADLREGKPNATVPQLLSAFQDHGVPISYSSGGATVTTTRINLMGAYGSLTGTNGAPTKPYNPSPGAGATGIATSATLTWLGGDPDGDPVTYDVMFGTTNNPTTVICNDVGTTTCTPTLVANKKYYWKVAASDDHSHKTTGAVWSFTTAKSSTVLNDDYDSAIDFTGSLPFSDSRNTTNATLAPDDPYNYCTGEYGTHSVWYRFTAPDNGLLHVDTIGSNYDTVLGIFTGSRGSLIFNDCDDEGGGSSTSLLEIQASQGTTYYVKVESWATNEFGPMDFNATFTPSSNIAPFTPISPTPWFTNSTTFATGVSASPLLSWTGGDPDLGDLVTYDVYMSDTNNPPNIPGDLVCHVVGASSCTPTTAPLGYSTTYYWQVVAGDGALNATGPVWRFTTNVTPPANDDIANAIDTGLVTNPSSYTDAARDITGAMTAANDPFFKCVPGQLSQTVWYTVTPTHNGFLSLDTTGSLNNVAAPLDTVLGVWAGTPGSLTPIACNDDESSSPVHIVTSKLTNILVNNGVTYYIEAASLYGGGTSLTLNASFVNINTPPTQPNTPLPANAAKGVSTNVLNTPGLSWSGGDVDVDSDPVLYDVKFGTTNPPKTLICDDVTTPLCVLPDATLAYGKKYYWQVTATDSFAPPAVTKGPVWSFTTEIMPPTLSAPKNGGSVPTKLPKFTWKAVKSATSYNLQIDTVDTFDSGGPGIPLFETNPDPTKATYTLKASDPELDYEPYFWRVQARVGGVWTDFSTPFSFDVTLNKTPAKGAPVLSHLPKFTWQAAKNPILPYHLEVFGSLSDCDTQTAPLVQKTNLQGTSYQMKLPADTPLDFGTYYWHVSPNAGSSWTPCWPFDVTSLKTPKDGSASTNKKPAFTWAAGGAGVSGYTLDVSVLPDGGVPAFLFSQTPTPPKYTAVGGDFPGFGHYLWHVTETGGYPMATPDFDFYITNMLKPANKAFTVDNTPTFSWTKITGATYTLDISTDPGFGGILHSYNAGNKLAYTVPMLDGLARGTYYWRIVTAGVVHTMPGWSFTVGP